ncbi:MAG: DivIVA domain-containing protein [Oscillospiraceae bacterium]|jgi:DivIVA domain-containing protein|nr:DivIVA domain-containing protein [Oscillospiraceae bacterium]
MNANLSFSEEKNGYSKSQVDAYLGKLVGEYQNLHTEYKGMENKYGLLEKAWSDLTDEKEALETEIGQLREQISALERQQPPSFAGEVARVLIDAEMLAKQIVERANAEAERMTSEGKAEYGQIYEAKEQLLREIQDIDQNLQTLLSRAF